jgi:hypothetical protein
LKEISKGKYECVDIFGKLNPVLQDLILAICEFSVSIEAYFSPYHLRRDSTLTAVAILSKTGITLLIFIIRSKQYKFFY